MENNQEQKIKKVLAAVLAIVFFLSVFALAKTLIYDKTKNKSNLTEDKKNEGKLFSSPSFLEIYPMESAEVSIFFTPKNSQETINVTKKTTLLSDSPEMVNVSMAEETYGQVVAQKQGEYSIRAAYKGNELDIPVNVKKAELKIKCNFISEGRPVLVGQKVRWMMYFERLGTPRYTYRITGSDGLYSHDPFVEIIYKTSGQKTARMEAVDYTGTEAAAECDPITVYEKK